MLIFDSHAHYFDRRFQGGAEGQTADELLPSILAPVGEVSHIINVGTNVQSSMQAIEQAAKYDGMYAAVGIHPEDCQMLDGEPEQHLRALRELLGDQTTRKRDKIVALGEIGLDYHYPNTDKERQMRYFEAQMSLARSLKIPVCIHDRDSHGDIMDMIRRFPDVRGVLHSFSGSAEMAEELISLGYMISFSGTLTFTNARKPKEVAARISKEFVMIETDAPYLAPHPKRGTLNHSGNLEYTNATLAAILGISPEECAILTEDNAKRFYGIKS